MELACSQGSPRRHTNGDIIVLLKFNPVSNFQIINLLQKIQSMSHRHDFQILQRIMVQMNKHIAGNFIFYN